MANATGPGLGRSTAGRFPTALRGYETSAVDAHIEALESQLAVLSTQCSAIGERIGRLEDELTAASARLEGALEHGVVDGSEGEPRRLEAMVQSIIVVLQRAHEEADMVRQRAEDEARAILRNAEARLTGAGGPTFGDGADLDDESVPAEPAP